MTYSELHEKGVKIALHGRLDTTGVGAIETRFAAAAARKNTLVDLSDVTFLASMGIRMLISAARSLKLSGNRLVLFGAPTLVGEVLDNAGLGQIIAIAPDEGRALEMLAG
ncbi:MAG: STAS domain-containing protein [Casimicrobiaceae bacterium]